MEDKTKVILIFVVYIIAMFLLAMYSKHHTSTAVEYVQENGLKTIAESIWCGKSGC